VHLFFTALLFSYSAVRPQVCRPIKLSVSVCQCQCHVGWSIRATRTFSFVDHQCSPNFFRPTGRVVVDQVFFRMFDVDDRSVPEIFAIKVESCQKSRRNFDVFWPSQIFGGGPSKSCTHIITPALRHVVWRSFARKLPLSPKLLRLTR